MCYSKTTPGLASTTPDETGFAEAFVTAAETIITGKKNPETATKWKTIMEASRVADGKN